MKAVQWERQRLLHLLDRLYLYFNSLWNTSWIKVFTCSSRPESLGHSILDILDSPSNETKPFVPTSSTQKVESSLSFSKRAFLHFRQAVVYKSMNRRRFIHLQPLFLSISSLRLFHSFSSTMLQVTELFEIIEKLQVDPFLSLPFIFIFFPDVCTSFPSPSGWLFCVSLFIGQQIRWTALWVPSSIQGTSCSCCFPKQICVN